MELHLTKLHLIKIIKVSDHCHYTGKYRGAAHGICNLRYKTPKKTPVVFHNGSKYNYHFITKYLAEELVGQLECLGENTEKYITFSVPIKKELDNVKIITYKLNFIDTFRFMTTSLSSLVDNFSEIYNKNVKTKIVNLSVILLDMKIINYIMNATRVKRGN